MFSKYLLKNEGYARRFFFEYSACVERSFQVSIRINTRLFTLMSHHNLFFKVAMKYVIQCDVIAVDGAVFIT